MTVLLDTHAAIWLDDGSPLLAAGRRAIEAAARRAAVLVSPISAWEIGILVAKRRLTLDIDAAGWFARFVALPGIVVTPLTAAAAIGASFLPGDLHGDPADRLLIATARELGVPLVTRDERILDYAALGHLDAIAC